KLVTEARLAALERRVDVLTALLEALGWTAIGLALAVVLMTVDRAGGQVSSNVFNVLHVVLSGVVALVSLRLSRRLLTPWLRRAWHHYLWAACSVLFLGGALEVAQRFGPGSSSLSDLVIDMAGGLGVLSVELGLRLVRRGRLAWLALGAGIVVLAAALLPSMSAFWVVLQRSKQFPVLTDFRAAEAPFISLNDGATMRRISSNAGDEWPIEVTWPGEGYPGLEVQPPAGNWLDYQTLLLVVHSDEPEPFNLE